MLTELAKLCFYIAVVLFIYFICPPKKQWWVLLCANIIFYLSYGVKQTVALLFIILISYGAGLWLTKESLCYKALSSAPECSKEEKKVLKQHSISKKRRILALFLLIDLGTWIALKETGALTGFAMPIGISYYSLIAAGYCIDLYRGKYEAEKNVFRYAAFLSFFLHMIQGPFSRYDHMKKTIYDSHSFSCERFYNGCIRIACGVFKKCMVADKLSLSVEYIYQNYQTLNGIYVFLGMIFWAIELYADFSGYMDMVNGAAIIFGITQQENFRQPFFARSIEEFWRRWHITLGAWFKDYLFYPVSMSKWAQKLGRNARKLLGNQIGRMLPSYIALFIVWSATGLWHGFSLHYLIWGLMQMVIIMFSIQMAPVYERLHKICRISADATGWKVFQMLRTFLLFGFMEIMSQAASVTVACSMYQKMFTGWDLNILTHMETIFPEMLYFDKIIVIIGVLLILLIDILKECKVNVYKFFLKIPLFPRYVIYIGVFYLIIICTTRGAGGGFVYANF